jgi:hypothetical protein
MSRVGCGVATVSSKLEAEIAKSACGAPKSFHQVSTCHILDNKGPKPSHEDIGIFVSILRSLANV